MSDIAPEKIETPPVGAPGRATRPRRWKRPALLTSLAVVVAAGGWAWQRWNEWPTQVVLRDEGNAWPLAFTPDGRSFVTANQSRMILWDTRTGSKRSTLPLPAGASGGRAVYAPDGRTLALSIFQQPGPSSIALIDVASGQVRATLATPHVAIYDLAFVNEGRQVRALLGDVPQVKLLRTWDVATGAGVASVPISRPAQGADTALSPDGRLLACVPYRTNAAEIWDLATDRSAGFLKNPGTGVPFDRGLAFAPDGRTLAIGRQDGSIELWDLATRQIRQRLTGHSRGHGSWGLRFAPDSRSLASEGYMMQQNPIWLAVMALSSVLSGRQPDQSDHETILIDLVSGQTVARASSAIHPIYSPDSGLIATRQTDFSVRIRPNPARPR